MNRPDPKRRTGRGGALILVADDFKDGRELVYDVLTYEGFDVLQASTGPDALEMTRKMMPDVLILDLSLPGLDGWEVARLLKEDRRTRKVQILVLTAHAEQSALKRARDAGSDAVMTKPCAPDDLVAETRRLARAGGAGVPAEEKGS